MSKLKRNEHHIKQTLKREKALRLRREALRNDMIDFLREFKLYTTEKPIEAYNALISEGTRGFTKMRGKDIVRAFEDTQLYLNSKDEIVFFKPKYNWMNTIKDWNQLNFRDSRDLRQEFTERANALSSRLLEVIFKLNEED